MVNTAVILAAGMGIRLRNIIQTKPKGFLEINGKPLIEYSIAKLIKSDIKNIIIVTGYLSEYYHNLAARFPEIKLIHNEEFANSGSMYSLFCAKEIIKEDFLLLESDLIYDIKAISEIQFFQHNDGILISGLTNAGDEVYVETADNILVGMSKNKKKLKIIAGELVGISKISCTLFERMLDLATTHFNQNLNLDYEDCIVSASFYYPIHVLKLEDLIWAEIDDETHFQRVQNYIYPLLQINETK